MGVESAPPGTPTERASIRTYPPGAPRFDRTVALLSSWPVLGLYLDGWAHINRGTIDTFLTPWHGVLYSGLVVIALFFIFGQYRNVRRGYAWQFGLPQGYALSLIGVGIFLLGGVFDFMWHTAFGFEADIETLLSPPHLMLATGGSLMVTGPVRAALSHPPDQTPASWQGLWPTLLALLLLLSLLTFFTQYVHFTTAPGIFVGGRPGATFTPDLLGGSSALIYTGALMGIVLYAVRRWPLPAGSMTLLIGGNTILMFLMRYKLNVAYLWPVAAVVGAGVAADLIQVTLKPSVQRPSAFHAFAFLIPVTVFLAYYITLVGTVGTWWSIHMWFGVPLQAGVVGLLLSYLVDLPSRETSP